MNYITMKAFAAVVSGDLYRNPEFSEIVYAQQCFGSSGANESTDTMARLQQFLGNQWERRRTNATHDQKMLTTRLVLGWQREWNSQRT
tara:strand:+ start:450 stop:713 length:264 start_codon:yes stop_codon:yes gene_type:complete